MRTFFLLNPVENGASGSEQALVDASRRLATFLKINSCKPTYIFGALADPADFNKKVIVLFFSTGTLPPLENPEGLKFHQQELVAYGITNSHLFISEGTSHEWQTWRRSLLHFAPLLFQN